MKYTAFVQNFEFHWRKTEQTFICATFEENQTFYTFLNPLFRWITLSSYQIIYNIFSSIYLYNIFWPSGKNRRFVKHFVLSLNHKLIKNYLRKKITKEHPCPQNGGFKMSWLADNLSFQGRPFAHFSRTLWNFEDFFTVLPTRYRRLLRTMFSAYSKILDFLSKPLPESPDHKQTNF